jgi:hypothetical protein
MSPRKKAPTTDQKFKEIATKVGTYILGIAAIIGGLRAIIVEVWPEPTIEPVKTISAEDTCPLFLSSIPEENRFDLSLDADGFLPIADQIILVRFLDEIGVIGYMTVSHQAGSNSLMIHDTANDKCIGTGKTYYETGNGKTAGIELKDKKPYLLFMELDSAKNELHIKLTKE